MRFNSIVFFMFLAVVLAGLACLPGRTRRVWLLVCSYAFYAAWHWPYLALMFGTAVVAWLGAHWIDAAAPPRRKMREGAVLGVFIGELFVYKYLDWAIANGNALSAALGIDWNFPALSLVLPLGVSFYVFEAMSYTIDVARKKEKPHGFWEIQLFIAFFPKLIAGPIMRAKELLPQFAAERRLRPADFRDGFVQIAFGVFVKVVLADGLAAGVDDAFKVAPESLGPLDAWLAACAFGLQMYFDFSSYSRIALGTALMCGVRLVENFNFPFSAANPVDFWNRWHMSLSRWIRDYLFFTLVGGKLSLANMCKAAVVSMVICGIWHGAAWRFAAWGLVHGLLIAGYHLYRHFTKSKADDTDDDRPKAFAGMRHAAAVAAFNLALLPTWILFRAKDLHTAFKMMFAGVNLGTSSSLRNLPGTFYLHTAALLALVWLSPRLYGALTTAIERWRRQESIYAEPLYSSLAGAVSGLLLACSLVYIKGQNAFIYFDF